MTFPMSSSLACLRVSYRAITRPMRSLAGQTNNNIQHPLNEQQPNALTMNVCKNMMSDLANAGGSLAFIAFCGGTGSRAVSVWVAKTVNARPYLLVGHFVNPIAAFVWSFTLTGVSVMLAIQVNLRRRIIPALIC